MRKSIVVALVAGVVVSLAWVSASTATGAGELVVRSSRVDYEVGQRVDWTVDWINGQPGEADEEVLVSLDGPHDFISNSIEMPRGWRVEYSENGQDYSAEPTGQVGFLKFFYSSAFPPDVSSIAIPGDVLAQTPIPQPITPIVTAANGGDGYIPILAGDRIYGVWHHLTATGTPAAHMVCIDTNIGRSCPEYPKKLNWQTSYNQGQGIFVDGKIYIKNRDATTHGVLCWDTNTEESCGYTPVANLGPVTGTAGGDGGWDQFSSPILHGGRLFFAGHNFRVYCFDPVTEKVCTDYGMNGRATARVGETHVTTRRLNDVVSYNGRMIFSLAMSWADGPIPLGTKDSCFDLDTGAPCIGFGTNGVVTETSATAYTFLRYDAGGKPVGYCHGVQSGAGEAPLQANIPCYDFDGQNRTTIPSVQPFGQFRPYNVEEATIGTRTFFGRYSTLGAYCYDWSTSRPCVGTYFDANGRSTQSLAEHFYGFVRRGECMVGLGHKGVFMSVDPLTGASPCRQVTDSNFVSSAGSRFCRDTKYLDGWRVARVSGVLSSDFSKMELMVTDGVKTVAGDVRSSDLVLTSLDDSKALRMTLNATVNPGADPWAKGTPTVNLLYGGSHQFCFQTRVKATTAPLVVEAETDDARDKEVVPVGATLGGTGEPNDAETSRNSGDKGENGQLPATGRREPGLIPVAVAMVVVGGILLERTTVNRRRCRA